MSIFRNSPVLLGLMALLAIAPATAGELGAITLANFLPASAQTQSQFSCVGSTASEPDVSIAFETISSGPGKRSSRVKSLTVRGQALGTGLLDELNGIVGKDSVTMATAGCADKDVRVVVGVYRPGNVAEGESFDAGNDYIYIYLDGATGKLRVE
ncbi:MAG TPA: hypothetical protein VFQ84_11725 [Arenimonas sp.]|uniref:hypothetical protein n=1 Tax=Arenimonas sp. TaxID=1872635 RepID=UPI002D7E3A2E|nr:hypothetical protein [Arenimonas sp.]HEU0154000.1 hypothetical protein [Arenimonas sp.]